MSVVTALLQILCVYFVDCTLQSSDVHELQVYRDTLYSRRGFQTVRFFDRRCAVVLGSLIGGAPWCEVLLIGVAPWWWLVLELVAELLEIILVKGVVYCTTLGSCVLRVAGCWLPGAVGRSKVQHDGT